MLNFHRLLLILLFFLFPFGQLTRISPVNSQIGCYFHDVIIVLILASWFIKKIKSGKLPKCGRIEKAIFAFWLTALISFLLNCPQRRLGEILIASFYLLRWGSYAGLYWVIKETAGLKEKVFKWLIGAGTAAAALGLIQYFIFPDLRLLTAAGWDPHLYRVVGTYLEPGFAGLIFVLTIILIINQLAFINADKEKKIKKFLWLLLAICYLAMALTYSRSAYLAYILGMTTIAIFKKSLKFFLLVISVFLLTLFLLPRPAGEGVNLTRQVSFWSRWQSWQQGFLIFRQKPIFGVGFNFYRYAAGNRSFSHAGAGTDNSFIFVLATTGILGLVFYSRLLLVIIKDKFLTATSFSLAIGASLVALISHSLFNNSLFYAWVMIWFWIMIAT